MTHNGSKGADSCALHELEKKIGYRFHDTGLLRQALTHSSFSNEHRQGKSGCNERLEFLGDAVLEVISSEFLYTHYPRLPEGELTKKRASLVCEPALAYCARQFGLPEHLRLGKGEERSGGRGRDSIVSDATEALLGAIYLDGGFASAKEFVLTHILHDVEHMQLFYDSKTILQEMVQELSADQRRRAGSRQKVCRRSQRGRRVPGTGAGTHKKSGGAGCRFECDPYTAAGMIKDVSEKHRSTGL